MNNVDLGVANQELIGDGIKSAFNGSSQRNKRLQDINSVANEGQSQQQPAEEGAQQVAEDTAYQEVNPNKGVEEQEEKNEVKKEKRVLGMKPVLGWLVIGTLLIGAGVGLRYYYKNKKANAEA